MSSARRLAPGAIAGVAFDLDGTLLDTVGDIAAAVNALLADLRLPPLPTAAVRDLVGKGMPNLIGRAIEIVRGNRPEAAEVAELLPRLQVHYAERLGRETTLFPGVVEGLATMHEAGLRLAVVTNKASRFVLPHLEHAGIAHYFAALVGGDDAPAKKPDPAPLALAARRLGIALPQLAMVGDSVNDALAARAAGCPVLIVPYGYNEGLPVEVLDCDGIVGSLREAAERILRADDTVLARSA